MQMTLSCAEESRAAEETLAGTCKPADTFCLIESDLADSGGWQAGAVKAAARSGIFAPILRHLSATQRAKTLFIRRPLRADKNFFIALANQPQPRMYHAELSDYAELLYLDLDSLKNGGAPRIKGRAMREIDELYAICVNGRHDPCCATLGAPVYEELVAQAGDERVWQTTHLGGHRLAATMLAFPQGIAYGHLDAADAEALVANHRAGYLLTHKYRGRGAYAGHHLDGDTHQAVGAAETFVRDLRRNYRIDGLRLDGVDASDSRALHVRFIDDKGVATTTAVRASMSAPRQTSCGETPKPMPQFEVALCAAP